MKRRAALLLAGWLALPAAGFAQGAQPTVEVFTLSTIPLTNTTGATVHYLDTVSLLEQQLSADLPQDPERAAAVARERMARMGAGLTRAAQQGAQSLARAAFAGVDRVPVVVFNGQWAVYGVPDVAEAQRLYLARAQGGSGR